VHVAIATGRPAETIAAEAARLAGFSRQDDDKARADGAVRKQGHAHGRVNDKGAPPGAMA
jgi:hypothetical protein